MNLKKLLGKLARLLLAVGAEKWKQGPAIQVQALHSGMELPVNARVLIPERHAAPLVEQQPVVIPASAPNTVVTPLPTPYTWNVTAHKVLEQLQLSMLAFVGTAGLWALDAIVAQGFLENLRWADGSPVIPTWLPVPAVHALLNAVRERVRRHFQEQGE